MVAAALAVAVPSCTLVGLGVGASVTATHNGFAEERDDWNYTTPVLVGAGIGLVFDILLIMYMSKQWSKPMT